MGDGNLITKLMLLAGLVMGCSPAIADELKEYGQYLSGECTTCHQIDGTYTEGIPPINGLDSESFIMGDELVQEWRARQPGHGFGRKRPGR